MSIDIITSEYDSRFKNGDLKRHFKLELEYDYNPFKMEKSYIEDGPDYYKWGIDFVENSYWYPNEKDRNHDFELLQKYLKARV